MLDDYGRIGLAWAETDVERTDLETIITDMPHGKYSRPVRVIGFNTAEGWSRDVSEDVARELRQRRSNQDRDLPDFLYEFVEPYVGPNRGVQLALPIRGRPELGERDGRS